jgi:DNA-binding transcriptional ArsR family regulator
VSDLEQVHILRNDHEAKLLFDDMRREILRLLAKETLTPQRLSMALGLSAPTVGHHLEALKTAGLVRMVGTEAETHGILQKFYRASASAYVIDTRGLSPKVKRYFMPANIERTRGILAALSLNAPSEYRLSSDAVETATEELGRLILKAAERCQGSNGEADQECVINRIYRESLSGLIKMRPNILPASA